MKQRVLISYIINGHVDDLKGNALLGLGIYNSAFRFLL